MFLRLRQLCLVAAELDPVVSQLEAVLGIPVCHRDPGVGKYGLHNALLPVGTGFLEVVAPLREGTTAGRYLQRRGGDGGYMVILDTESLPRWKTHFGAVQARIAANTLHPPYEGLQLHPKDTGGALLEVNCTEGNGADPWGPYWPAGDHWQDFSKHGMSIEGVTLQSPDPARLARRWAQCLQLQAGQVDGQWNIRLENATLYFTTDQDGRGEGLSGIALVMPDGQAVLGRARQAGCLDPDGGIHIGGIRFSVTELARQ